MTRRQVKLGDFWLHNNGWQLYAADTTRKKREHETGKLVACEQA